MYPSAEYVVSNTTVEPFAVSKMSQDPLFIETSISVGDGDVCALDFGNWIHFPLSMVSDLNSILCDVPL
jgi:hypothetical protein